MQKSVLLLMIPFVLLAREWTALVYMAADNSLASLADSDLVEMQVVGSTDDMAIVVQVDKPSIGARRMLVGSGTAHVLQELGIIDMCDWQTLSEFLRWGIQNYPANKYCVILWDHATGWTMMPKGSFGSDWSSGTQLSISNGDFKKAISTAYDYTREKIDLFAFDACLMQQIEVAFEIKDYATVFVAPQNVCPLKGFRYDRILRALDEDPGMNEFQLARHIVEINTANYLDIQPVVYSAINLLNVDKLMGSSDKLVRELMSGQPNQSVIELRDVVQTIPLLGQTPSVQDELVDWGDFITGLDAVLQSPESEQLLHIYNTTILKSDYWGEQYSRTTGLTIWYPFRYLTFKQLLDDYINLSWAQSQWPRFLNWLYGEDDVRPRSVNVNIGRVGENNDFRIYWPTSYDLAPVTYTIIDAEDTLLVFSEDCEDAGEWYFNGFTSSAENVHSGNYSFFSGNASNLMNSCETRRSILIEDAGLLSIYLYYNTEEIADSLIIEYGSLKDVHYGLSNGWQERRTILPAGNHSLKISYHTNESVNRGGCYIDDIKIYNLCNGRYLREHCVDTVLSIYNKKRGTYYYTLFPVDSYENKGNVSSLARISLEEYAVPYSTPSPFQTSCTIVLDYPDTLQPSVHVFSISGRRIREFASTDIDNKTVLWDGKDEYGRDVGSGLYFVLLKDGLFKRIGKIARQR